MQDIDQSVAMLKEAAAQGLKAVNIPAFPQAKTGTAGGGFAAQVLALTGDPRRRASVRQSGIRQILEGLRRS